MSDKIYVAARKGLVEYRQIFLPTPGDVAPASFHYDWSNDLLNSEGHIAYEGFRESLPLDTEIPTTKGFKKISDIKVGDFVFNKDGKKVEVDYVSPVFNGMVCYRLDFDDGTNQVCSEEHIWYVNDKKKRRVRNVATKEMAVNYEGWAHKNGYMERRFRVPVCGAVNYTKKKLPVNPYILGFWIGDGTHSGASFTIGKRDIEELKNIFIDNGYKLNARSDGGREIHYSVLNLQKKLRLSNLIKNKHIPEIYLQSDVNDRLELLKGLIDSDGCIAKNGTKTGTVSFCTIKKQLARQVLELVKSLGWKSTITKNISWFNNKQYNDCYKIHFKPDVFVSKLSFKRNNVISKKDQRSLWKTIKKITKVESVQTKCIGVKSEEGTYLITRDYIVTHNSGKGAICLRAFPLYTLTFPDERWKYMVLIKANQQQARKALKTITSEFMNNPFISGRLLKVVKNTSDIFEVVLDCGNGKDMNMLIEAYGKGASIRGLNNKDVRPTILLLDDCQDHADMLSEVVPENDWDWFLSDVMFLGQTARVFMIANNLGERCIVERVANNADSLGFKFRRIACANQDLTVSAWAEKTSIEEIRKERADFEAIGKLDVWMREKMCIAVSEEAKLFNDSMYRYYPSSLKNHLASTGEILAALDPASSKRKDSCFRSISVGALMDDGHWYILDNPYGRWDSIELMNKMFEVVRKWGVRDFGIEKGQYQQFLEPVLYREMTLRKCRFNVTPLEHGRIGSKLERIKMLQPYFKSGSVWFPEGADWLTEMKSELAGVTRDELKSEFVDLVDSLAMLLCQLRSFSARDIRDEKYRGKRSPEYVFNPMTC